MTTKKDLELAVLDLNEEVERPRVKLHDGNVYELRRSSDFSVVEQTNLQRHFKKVQRINDGEGDMSDLEAHDLKVAFSRLMEMLLPDVPSEVRENIPPPHQNRILEFFRSFTEAATANQTNGPSPAGQPTSPPSSGSTAGTRPAG